MWVGASCRCHWLPNEDAQQGDHLRYAQVLCATCIGAQARAILASVSAFVSVIRSGVHLIGWRSSQRYLELGQIREQQRLDTVDFYLPWWCHRPVMAWCADPVLLYMCVHRVAAKLSTPLAITARETSLRGVPRDKIIRLYRSCSLSPFCASVIMHLEVHCRALAQANRSKTPWPADRVHV